MNDVRNITDSTVQKNLSCPASYQADGRQFIVEPVFQASGQETIGTVLLKLMKSELSDA